MKKYTRSKNNRIIAGVCGGLGEYYKSDPLIIRLIAILLFFLSGFIPLILIYIIAIFIIPNEDEEEIVTKKRQKNFLWLILSLLALFIIIQILAMLIGFSLFKTQSNFNLENYSPRDNQIIYELP
jgi:phage shock protein C